jgi:hypothetical protein
MPLANGEAEHIDSYLHYLRWGVGTMIKTSVDWVSKIPPVLSGYHLRILIWTFQGITLNDTLTENLITSSVRIGEGKQIYSGLTPLPPGQVLKY